MSKGPDELRTERIDGVTVRRLPSQSGSCGLADSVVTVHEPYRQLATAGISEHKVNVVMNAVDTELVERALSAHSGAPETIFKIAYHGTSTEWYGVDLVVQALVHLRHNVPNARARIRGDGDALPRLEAMAREADLVDHIEFSDDFPPLDETLRRSESANVGVIPNLPTA